MITIALDLRGTLTHASCTYFGGGDPQSFFAIENTGAKALTALVERLAKEKLSGLEYEVAGHPELSGIVPGKTFRRPTHKPKIKQERWAI